MSSTVVANNPAPKVLLPPNGNGGEIFYPESDGKPMAETDIHRKQINYLIESLELFFENALDVQVTGNMMFYYEKDNPRKFISPDVMVVKGVEKHLRRVFKLWEEQPPRVIFEISSRSTWGEDINKKWLLYQQFGVREYYIFDPEYDYLPEPIVAYRLNKDGEFIKAKVKKGRIFSPELNLELVDTGESLRLFNPNTKSFLPNFSELAGQAQKAEQLAAENERLKAEIARLTGQN